LWVCKMRTVLGMSIIVVLGAVVFLNALFMLVSPKAWFRLSRWIGAHGTLTEREYSSGWRSVTVRLGGAATIVVIGWVLYDSLIGPGAEWMHAPFSRLSGARWLCVAGCIGVLTCGLIMLFMSRWWIKRYFRDSRLKETVLVRAVRILSCPSLEA